MDLASEQTGAPSRTLLRGSGRAKRWAHVLGLAVVLFGVLLFIHPGVAISSDEGAAILEGRQVLARGRWLYTNPLPRVDPSAVATPFPHGDRGTKGLAPYAKHPLYPVLLGLADRIAGSSGVVALTVLGTLLAAIGAALLAARTDERLFPWVLWATGIGCPLLVDSYFVLAHTLAAAAAVAAVLWALVAAERRSATALRWAGAVGMCAGVALSAALRSEGAFLGVGLALGLVALALSRRTFTEPVPPRAPVLLGLAAACVATVAAVRLIESRILIRLIGDPLAASSPTPARSWSAPVTDRWRGLLTTWFKPGYLPTKWESLSLLLAAIGIAGGALASRSDTARRWGPWLVGMGLISYAVRLGLGDPALVPGILLVSPLVLGGVAWLRRAYARDPALLLAFVVTVVVVGGVVLTDYPIGGGIEWGGRYYALILPIAMPLLMLSLARGSGKATSQSYRRFFVAALAAATAVVSVLGLWSVRREHVLTGGVEAAVARAAATTSAFPADRPITTLRSGGHPDDRPILVTASEALYPQLDWNHFDRYRWLVTTHAELAGWGASLRRSGVASFVLVGASSQDVAVLAPLYRTAAGRPGDAALPIRILVMVGRPPTASA